jgi:hypothetical protein
MEWDTLFGVGVSADSEESPTHAKRERGMDNVISILSGKESIPGASRIVDLAVFSVRGTGSPVRISLGHADRKVGNSNNYSAGRNLRQEVAGMLTAQSYNIPDNTILRVCGSISANNATNTKKAVIRVDHRAPYNRLLIPTSGHDRSMTPHLYVEGHFWLLPEEEVAKEGYFHRNIFHRNIDQVFRLQELQPGAPQPQIDTKTVTIEGEEKKVFFQKPKRALRL